MLSSRYYYKSRNSDEIPDGYSCFVTGVGRFRLVSLHEKYTDYPPRRDHQLLYVKSGVCYFEENGIERKAGKGSVLIWPKGHKKQWHWKLEDKPDVYWVQFGGIDTDRALKDMGLDTERAHILPENEAYIGIFEKIMQEMRYRQKHFEEFCATYLQQIFLTLSRDIELVKNRKKPLPAEIIRTVRYMEEHYPEEIYLDSLAKINFTGKSRLIKLFKYHLGMSPIKYLNSLRVEKAALLLQEGNSIDSVAKQVGFSDRLYFSKVFREKVGTPPAVYRRQHREDTLKK